MTGDDHLEGAVDSLDDELCFGDRKGMQVDLLGDIEAAVGCDADELVVDRLQGSLAKRAEFSTGDAAPLLALLKELPLIVVGHSRSGRRRRSTPGLDDTSILSRSAGRPDYEWFFLRSSAIGWP